MTKYRVLIERISYAYREIEIEAESQEQAEEKAHEVSGNYEYREHTAEYTVNVLEAA